MKPPIPGWVAIAAMAENRVIGAGNRIPWHLPEDFRWFKEVTMGGTLVMGRKTFESIGRPLPGRRTVVLTRGAFTHPAVVTVHDPGDVDRLPPQGITFLCGGAQVYAELLPRCSELLLTRVHLAPEGDALFPPFEHLFERVKIIRNTPEFTIERWLRRDHPPFGPG